MKKNCFIIIALFLCGSLWNVNAQTRGGDLEAVVGPNVTVGKQWAVFIAIDRYQEWAPLSYPVRDAKEIRDILLEYYYIDAVWELYDRDATAAGIRQLFADLHAQVNRDDSVFVFYAGHGYTDRLTNTGSWIPSDGGMDVMAQTNWIPNIQIRNILSRLPAKHVFLVVDSCFSGDILDINRGIGPQIDSEYYRRAYSRVSRKVMTSGSSEEVPDASEFAMRLKSSLRRAQGASIDTVYLFTNVRQVRSTQPLLGVIRGSEHQEGGSFLFFRRQTPGGQTGRDIPGYRPPERPAPPSPPPLQPSLRSANVAFRGDTLAERNQQTVIFGLRDAIQASITDFELDDNEDARTHYGFIVTVFNEQTTVFNSNIIRSEVTIAFTQGGRVLHQTGPYHITETTETLVARRIVERLRRDQAFFNRVNEAVR
jgi:hypothetical protein